MTPRQKTYLIEATTFHGEKLYFGVYAVSNDDAVSLFKQSLLPRYASVKSLGIKP